MNQPAISVVITTHNRAEILPRAIESVVAQTYGDYDVHIVDDSSSDNTPDVVKSIIAGKENYYYWRHEDKRGLASARNTGISHSSGKYIAFLDDDDQWKPQCLEKKVNLLESIDPEECENLGVVYCGCETHMVSGNRTTYNMPQMDGNIKEQICSIGLWTIPSSNLFPRKVLEAIGGFDETLFSSVDHDIWMNLATHDYCTRYVNEPLVVTYYLKQHKSMVSNTIPRITGVEQYLAKWSPVYKDWFGEKGARKYVIRYRSYVLGGLAADKLCSGNIRESIKLFRHVIIHNRWALPELMYLLNSVSLKLFRMCVPGTVIDKMKRLLNKDSHNDAQKLTNYDLEHDDGKIGEIK